MPENENAIEPEVIEEDTLECCARQWDGTAKVPAGALWFRDQGGQILFSKDDSGEPGFEMDLYTGAAMPHPWFGKVVISAEGVDLGESRNGDGRKIILREHERDRVVGFGYPVRHGHHIKIRRGKFSKVSADGQEVAGLLAEGMPLECSINIDGAEVVDLPKGQSMAVNGRTIKGPAVVFTKSRIREGSICSLGMDAATSASITAASGDVIDLVVKKEGVMPEETNPIETPAVDVEAVKAEAIAEGAKLEQARFAALNSEFGKDFAVEMFAAGKSVEDARAEDYKRLKVKCAELEAKLEAAPVHIDGRALPVQTGVKPEADKPKSLEAAAKLIMEERNAKGESLTQGQAMKLACKIYGFKDAR
ncbi:MAG TPA: hypothetical protein VM223_16875 [Planctomycetota bacterium]|nr:hypothetical protein [Planctomycetota bacterium]